MTTVNELLDRPATRATDWDTKLDAIEQSISRHAHWLLRGTLASVFVYHGLLKFAHLDAMSEMLGLPLVIVALVALVELGGGVFVILGGLMFAPVMIGAIVLVHWGQWNFVPSATHPKGGMQFQVALLLLSLFFALKGNKA
jgi:putative oxidoreductase